ncbi:MAG: MFS transporter [Chloroflexi bacterium]|nr:MFS transporter [Chloroflexota bacterium]
MLLVVGVATSIGNAFGGVGSDRFGAARMLTASCVMLIVSLALLSVSGGWAPGAVAGVAVWGLTMGAFLPAQQSRLVALAPAAVDVALALNLSALSLGAALGALLGGAVIEWSGFAPLGYVGASVIALALIGVTRPVRRSSQASSQALV